MSRAAGCLRRAGEELAELAWPKRCVCCNMPGPLLCEDCRAALPWIAQRWACPQCGAPFGWLTCTACERSRDNDGRGRGGGGGGAAWPTRALVCCLPFRGAGATLVSTLKDGHELRLAPVMAAAMACSLDEATAWDATDGRARYVPEQVDALCFVPATARAYARRGFDHMELVARSLSGAMEIPLLDALVRHAAKDQRCLGRAGRAENLEGTVGVVDDVSGLRVLLADDVVTTGATLREAARALLDAGAESITACALARVC